MAYLREAAQLSAVDRAVYGRLSIGDMAICIDHLIAPVTEIHSSTRTLRRTTNTAPAPPFQRSAMDELLRRVSTSAIEATIALNNAGRQVQRTMRRIGPDGMETNGPTDVRHQVIRPVRSLTNALVATPVSTPLPQVVTGLLEAAEAVEAAISSLRDSAEVAFMGSPRSRGRSGSTVEALESAEDYLRGIAALLRRIAQMDGSS